MARHLNLRQIEAFKAVIEHGTLSAAAETLNISQPAMSKLIAHLEADSGLKIFDRIKGRLAPTEHGMRLYDEIDRIFAGVRQVENAVDAIRREEQGRLMIGVMPALAGSFIQKATMAFLKERKNVFCAVHARSSQWIVDWLVTRQVDIGLISSRVDNPYVESETVMEHPLVCIMPLNHPLAAKTKIGPDDLHDIPFISFDPDSHTGQRVMPLFSKYKIRKNVVLVASVSPTLCEFVSAGLGVSLVHPFMVSGMQDRLAIRRFEPKIEFGFKLCHSRDGRNRTLVAQFMQEVRAVAARTSREILNG